MLPYLGAEAARKGLEGGEHEATLLGELVLDELLHRLPQPGRELRQRGGGNRRHPHRHARRLEHRRRRIPGRRRVRRRRLGDERRGLGGGPRIPEQCRAVLPAILQQVQLVEDARHVHRAHGLRQYADRAERAGLAHVQLAFLRGVHHEGDGRGLRIALDRLHGLEPVHAGHEVIHEDHVGTVLLQVLEGLLRGFSRIDRQPVLLEHAAQDHPGRARVIHDQGAFARRHSSYPLEGGPEAVMRTGFLP